MTALKRAIISAHNWINKQENKIGKLHLNGKVNSLFAMFIDAKIANYIRTKK